MAYDYFEYKPMIQALPHFLRDIKEYQALYAAFEVYFLDLGQEMYRMSLRTSFDDLDETGCEMWEKVMGLSVFDGATIQDRINNIKATAANDPPYTDATLESKLKLLCGEDGYEITRDYGNYYIEIKIALENKHYLAAVSEMIQRILPCNLDRLITLMYNTWEMVAGYTWADVSSLTWYDIKEEVLP